MNYNVWYPDKGRYLLNLFKLGLEDLNCEKLKILYNVDYFIADLHKNVLNINSIATCSLFGCDEYKQIQEYLCK